MARSGRTTLAIDVGGSHVKAASVDAAGEMIGGPARFDTPHPAMPTDIVDRLAALVRDLGPFDRISVGFPGVVRQGRILTAPNLGNDAWENFPLADTLTERFNKPARVLNDAEVQGLGVIAFKGLECAITLGTGLGFALFQDGRLGPHLELAHHPFRRGRTYEDYVGRAALDDVGTRKWNRRVRRVIATIERLVSYDVLYIGGGNAEKLTPDLPANVKIVANEAGITGGVRLWDRRMDAYFA